VRFRAVLCAHAVFFCVCCAPENRNQSSSFINMLLNAWSLKGRLCAAFDRCV
jgi:hypothetical protein